MPSETSTPNIGLQVPAFDQANWQVPLNYDLNLLDEIMGGEVQIPAISVVTLTAVNFNLPSVIATIAGASTTDVFTGTATAVFTCTHIPVVIFGVYLNGSFQAPGASYDYTVSGNQVTFSAAVASTDIVCVVYLHN